MVVYELLGSLTIQLLQLYFTFSP